MRDLQTIIDDEKTGQRTSTKMVDRKPPLATPWIVGIGTERPTFTGGDGQTERLPSGFPVANEWCQTPREELLFNLGRAQAAAFYTRHDAKACTFWSQAVLRRIRALRRLA